MAEEGVAPAGAAQGVKHGRILTRTCRPCTRISFELLGPPGQPLESRHWTNGMPAVCPAPRPSAPPQGILSPDDARKAVELGADGIIVSNHGGRQLNYSPAAVDMLPAIAGGLKDGARVELGLLTCKCSCRTSSTHPAMAGGRPPQLFFPQPRAPSPSPTLPTLQRRCRARFRCWWTEASHAAPVRGCCPRWAAVAPEFVGVRVAQMLMSRREGTLLPHSLVR